jgi:ribosome-associated heat shock protein Hsp15
MRIDKWLWSARFFKTRSLASEEIQKGRVHINDLPAKPSKELKLGDLVRFKQGIHTRTVKVMGFNATRGPASVAQNMYQETAESLHAKALTSERHRLNLEPALSIKDGRPTKRQRRELDEAQFDWDERWSASID